MLPKLLLHLPSDVIQSWPEVFKDLYLDTIPIEYLETLNITFINGSIWKFNVERELTNSSTDEISFVLLRMFRDIGADIQKIDFRINLSKLKLDIKSFKKSIP
jgi:hypothetical protein